MKLSDKLESLARQLAYASGVKESARLRSQCTLKEWDLVLRQAKDIYFMRFHSSYHYTKV